MVINTSRMDLKTLLCLLEVFTRKIARKEEETLYTIARLKDGWKIEILGGGPRSLTSIYDTLEDAIVDEIT